MKTYSNPQTSVVNLIANQILQSVSPENAGPGLPPYPAPARESYSPRQEPAK
ncbi:MAG: hypothetical protein J6Y00_01610 [Paludibacteraceae bacterium]|nr:hypothetical protein [Paludibacteraceae bacterium]